MGCGPQGSLRGELPHLRCSHACLQSIIALCEEKTRFTSSCRLCRSLSAVGRRVLSIESFGTFQGKHVLTRSRAYTHACARSHAYTRTHTPSQAHMHMHTPRRTHAHTQMVTHTYTHACTYPYVPVNVHRSDTHMFTPPYSHCVNTRMHTYANRSRVPHKHTYSHPLAHNHINMHESANSYLFLHMWTPAQACTLVHKDSTLQHIQTHCANVHTDRHAHTHPLSQSPCARRADPREAGRENPGLAEK